MARVGKDPRWERSLDGELVVDPGIVEPSQGERQVDVGEGWLTVQQAAEHTVVSRYKIGRLIRSGELPVYTTPFDRRRRLVHLEDLDDLRSQVVPWVPPAEVEGRDKEGGDE